MIIEGKYLGYKIAPGGVCGFRVHCFEGKEGVTEVPSTLPLEHFLHGVPKGTLVRVEVKPDGIGKVMKLVRS